MFNSSLFALRHHPQQRRHLIHIRQGVRNQQNLYLFPPTSLAWLLQYSGFKVEHRDGVSLHKCIAVKAKMVNLFRILRFGKNKEISCLETESNMK